MRSAHQFILNDVGFDKEVALHPVIFNFLQKFNQIDHLKSIFSIRALNLKKIRLHVILHRSIKYTCKKQLKRVFVWTLLLGISLSCNLLLLILWPNDFKGAPNSISNFISRRIVYLSYLVIYSSYNSNEIQKVSRNKLFLK